MKTNRLARAFWPSLILVSVELSVGSALPCWSQGIDLGAGQLDVDIRRRAVNEDVPGDRRSLDATTKRDHLRTSPTTPNLVLPASERNGLANPPDGLLRNEAAYVGSMTVQDQRLLEWVLADQSALIALGQYGMTRAESSELRQLAELVFQHHRALAGQLAQYRTAATAVPVPGMTQPGMTVPGGTAADLAVGRHVRGVGPTTPAEVQAAETRHNILVQQRRIQDARREAGIIAGPDDPVDDLSDAPLVRGEVVRGEVVRGEAPLPLEMEANLGAVRGTGEVVGSARERLGAAVDTDRGVRNEVVRGPEALAGAVMADPSLDLRRKVSDRVAVLVRDDLQGTAPEDFDAAYLAHLVAAHLHQEASLDIVRAEIDGPFEDAVNDALVEVRRHRAIAQRMQNGIRP
jgi:hypothetical protein